MDPAKRAEIDTYLLERKLIRVILEHYMDQQFYGVSTPGEHMSLRDRALERYGLLEAHLRDVQAENESLKTKGE
ncbi:hypothetical protein, partial [Streptomyces roseolus]|uniref:hypothetical protein n=1 Tax=Streptomyces roseolus TaxID=67358 RepID=UPI0036473E47